MNLAATPAATPAVTVTVVDLRAVEAFPHVARGAIILLAEMIAAIATMTGATEIVRVALMVIVRWKTFVTAAMMTARLVLTEMIARVSLSDPTWLEAADLAISLGLSHSCS